MSSKTEKYDLKIPRALYHVFKEYIESNPQLGYTNVSMYLKEVIRLKAQEVLLLKKEKD